MPERGDGGAGKPPERKKKINKKDEKGALVPFVDDRWKALVPDAAVAANLAGWLHRLEHDLTHARDVRNAVKRLAGHHSRREQTTATQSLRANLGFFEGLVDQQLASSPEALAMFKEFIAQATQLIDSLS